MTVPLTAPPQAIEIAADPAALRAMVAKTAAAWETVGETAPYHSVLTLDEYRPERFAENESSFFESGMRTEIVTTRPPSMYSVAIATARHRA